VNKRKLKVRRWQKILILVIITLVFILIWPMIKAPSLRVLMPSVRFTIPKVPQIEAVDKANVTVAPKAFVLWIASHDPKLLLQLQQQGWPAYMKNNEIQIGPYLESFKSQLDLTKIRQVTPITVKMSDVNFL
jgi:hypothetical protein